MATQVPGRRASIASTSTTSSRSSADSFLDLVKSTLEAATWMQSASREVRKIAAHRAATDVLSTEIVDLLFHCSRCLVPQSRSQPQWNIWSPNPPQSTATSTKSSSAQVPRKDLASSLLTYINNQIAHAQFQGLRLRTLTIVTNDLSVRQLRRLSSSAASSNTSKLSQCVRVFSTALGAWEVRVGGHFKIHLVHSQLRRVAKRLKADLALTLESVSNAIIAQGGREDASSAAKDLTDLYLLRAYFGTQLWLHEAGQRSGDAGGERRQAWYDIAALSFVEPYIDACPKAKAAAQLGRRVGRDMGLHDGYEEAELALMNEVLLQVVSPFSGTVT